MKQLFRLDALMLPALLLFSAVAAAQGSADDQANVWSTIEQVWAAEERGEEDWVDNMLSADFMGWPASAPAPRSKASTRMWNRFDAEQSKGLTHELYPLSIVVHGNVAIAHYLYTLAVQNKNKETVTTNGRYTDVLVRDGSDWKFLSWHGGDDKN